MKCSEFRDSVTDYLEQAISPAVRLTMEKHKEQCESCRSFMREMCLTVDALGALNRAESAHQISSELLSLFTANIKSASLTPSLEPEARLRVLLTCVGDDLEQEFSRLSRRELSLLGELAQNRAIEMGVRDPSSALALAEIGLEAQKALCAMEFADQEERGMVAEAWAVLGNARRISSDLRGAGEAFRNAEKQLADCREKGRSRARVLQLRSALESDCARPAEALQSIEESIEIYAETGDSHQVGRAMIGKGTIIGPVGDSREAVEILQEGLRLIDIDREPRLALVAKHNLVHSLLECGRREDALSILNEVREGHQQLGNRVDLIRFLWLEGSIYLELGNLEKAEASLLEARDYFIERGIAFEAARVSLDLAVVYLNQARISELKDLANEMVAVFRGLGIRREVFAALAFFHKALEIEQTAALGVLKDHLERVRSNENFRHHLTVSS